MRGFPWWFGIVVAGVHFWYVTAPTALALLLLGWYCEPGGLRWICLSGGMLLTLPFLMASLMYVLQSIEEARRWRKLARAETVAGVELPPGSHIRFADKAHTRLISIDLPDTTDILGMRMVGQLTRCETWNAGGPAWGGTLAEDQSVDGIPCRAGYFTFDKFGTVFDTTGAPLKFGLAASHDFFGLHFPKGTAVRRGNAKEPWSFLLPADSEVNIPVLNTTAPGGVTLYVTNDGQLDHIGSGHGQIIIVHGLPLSSRDVRVHDDQVIAELAEPFLIAGETLPAGTSILIDLPSGDVVRRL